MRSNTYRSPQPTSRNILEESVAYTPVRLGQPDVFTEELVGSRDVLNYYDGTPIAMVNQQVLLTTLMHVMGYDTVESLIDDNPTFSLQDLITVLYRYGAR